MCMGQKKSESLTGIKPMTSQTLGRHSIHWATRSCGEPVYSIDESRWQILSLVMKCVVSENIYTHPMEGHQKFRGGRGVSTTKIYNGSMKLNWKFLGGGMAETKKTFHGGGTCMDNSGTTQCEKMKWSIWHKHRTKILVAGRTGVTYRHI